MNRISQIWNEGGVHRRRAARRTGFVRPARILAGALCGLGFALFPGIGVLVIQACLVLVWAYFMVSLVVGGLRGASHGLR
jgi:hypothetical protein